MRVRFLGALALALSMTACSLWNSPEAPPAAAPAAESKASDRARGPTESSPFQIAGVMRLVHPRELPHGGLVFACIESRDGLTKYAVDEKGRFDAGSVSAAAPKRLIGFERTDPVRGAWRGPSNVVRVTELPERPITLTIQERPPLSDAAWKRILSDFVTECEEPLEES